MGPEAPSTSSTARHGLLADPDERHQKLIDDYKAHFANPYSAADGATSTT